jgi:hypothetical protein
MAASELTDSPVSDAVPPTPRLSPARLLKAILSALVRLPESDTEETASLDASLADYSGFVDRTWPDSKPSGDGAEARNREAELREKVIRSRARRAAARGWISIAVKASPLLISVVVLARLLGA